MSLAEQPSPSPPEILPPTRRATVIGMGLIVFMLLYFVWSTIGKSYDSAYFTIPFFVGVFVGLFSPRKPYQNGLIVLWVALAVLIAMFKEGVICMLFAMPVLLLSLILGIFSGNVSRRYARSRGKRRGVSTGVLLIGVGFQFASAWTNDPHRHPWARVETAIEIAAPSNHVFAVITSPMVLAGTWPAVLRVGLPIPSRMEVDRPGENGTVRLTFNHGTALADITRWQPGEAFSFRVRQYRIDDPPFFITRLGRGEHYGLKVERVDDWLTFGQLSYHIEPISPNQSRLVRSTEYQRHLFPSIYFGWLQKKIIGIGQRRMLTLLRDNIEAAKKDRPGGPGSPSEEDPRVALENGR